MVVLLAAAQVGKFLIPEVLENQSFAAIADDHPFMWQHPELFHDKSTFLLRAVNPQTRESAYRSGAVSRLAAAVDRCASVALWAIWAFDADQIGQCVSFRRRRTDVKLSFG
jgi:hypothetical protein